MERTGFVAERAGQAQQRYEQNVNPQWARLLRLLEMDAEYARCMGDTLETVDGRRIHDFLSAYCVYNTGHNHPAIVAALHRELDANGPQMLQSHVSATAAELAERLLRMADRSGSRHLGKVYFSTSGSEGVETAIKFSRAHTGRGGLLAARGGFHGLSCGALALMDASFWREGFGELIPGVEFVDFGDAGQLERALATGRFAALILEPVQGEAGIVMPPAGYLERAQELCRRHGTVFVLDEVQTGLGRTGAMLAAHHWNLEPDMVILAKALSGGLVPGGAVLMTDAIYESVYSSLRRAIVHTSTYSENGLAMRAGLATLEVIEGERLAERAERLGESLREQLRERLAGFEMVREVRGLGFFTGIVLGAPQSMALRLSFEAFGRVHPAMFGQMLVMRLYREHGILTQICGNNFLVLKVAPPLTASEATLEHFVQAMGETMETIHSSRSFWTDALRLAARAVRI